MLVAWWHGGVCSNVRMCVRVDKYLQRRNAEKKANVGKWAGSPRQLSFAFSHTNPHKSFCFGRRPYLH